MKTIASAPSVVVSKANPRTRKPAISATLAGLVEQSERTAEHERRVEREHVEAETLRRKFDEAAGESARYGHD